MFSSRWKSGNGGNVKIDSGINSGQKQSSKDAGLVRFGKDFNRNVRQPSTDPSDRLKATALPKSASASVPQPNPPIKTKPKFFHAFAKENVVERHIKFEIPKHVAPKAAALLQIPVLAHQPTIGHSGISKQHSYHRHELRKHDLIEAKFNVHLDRNSCDLIANSNQFALLQKSLSQNMATIDAPSGQDPFKPATIRRAPYWPTNQPGKYSKNLSISSMSASWRDCAIQERSIVT